MRYSRLHKHIICGLVASVVISASMCAAYVLSQSDGRMQTSLCLLMGSVKHTSVTSAVITMVVGFLQLSACLIVPLLYWIIMKTLREGEKERQKLGQKTNKKVSAVQSILVSISNVLCWFPANTIFLLSLVLGSYPLQLLVWTVIIGLSVNPILNPLIFLWSDLRNSCK